MCLPPRTLDMPPDTCTPWFMTGERPAMTDWAALWGEAVARFGPRPALVGPDGTMTYADLAVRAGELGKLIPRGGGIVALDASAEDFLVACVAMWSAGRAVLPFLPEHLAADGLLERQVRLLAGDIWRDGKFIRGTESPCSQQESSWHAVFFTSGSTGEPRAVVRGWLQAVYEAGHYARVLALEPGWRCRMLVDPVFGASTKHLLGCLLSGCLQDFSPTPGEGGEVLFGTPGQIADYARAARSEFSWISMTGEACSRAAWVAACAVARPGGRCLNALGGTEFGVAANMVTPAEGDVPVFRGESLPGKHLAIVDDSGKRVPDGESGLLQVSSGYLAEGYLDLPGGEPRLQHFAPPARHGGRRFMTGDVARIEAGRLVVLGRSGKMIKRGARWLDTSPLAQALAAAPGVRAFVIGSSGPSAARVCAWVELVEFGSDSLKGVADCLESSALPPSLVDVDLLAVRSLPRNRHGKVQLAALEALRVSSGKSDVLVHRSASRAERLAAKIWRNEQPGERVGLDELDSLGLAELCAALERLGGCRLDPACVASAATLGDLRRAAAGGLGSLCRVHGSGGDAVLLWFGGGAASALRAAGSGCRFVHWDLAHAAVPVEAARGADLRAVARECLGMWREEPRGAVLRVGGFSFGALVAYEAACLLGGRGWDVQVCALLDPPDVRARAIARLRWSAVRASILLGLLAPVARWFPYRVGRETRIARMAARRRLMRRYAPSTSSFRLQVFTSPGNTAATKTLLAPSSACLSVHELPVSGHVQVVRDRQAVHLWGACLRSAGPDNHSRTVTVAAGEHGLPSV